MITKEELYKQIDICKQANQNYLEQSGGKAWCDRMVKRLDRLKTCIETNDIENIKDIADQLGQIGAFDDQLDEDFGTQLCRLANLLRSKYHINFYYKILIFLL